MSIPTLPVLPCHGISLPGDRAQAVATIRTALDAAGLVVVLDVDVQGALAGRFDCRFHPYRCISAANLSVAERCQSAQDALLAALQTVIVIYDNGDGSSAAEVVGLADWTEIAAAGRGDVARRGEFAHPRLLVSGRSKADQRRSTNHRSTGAIS